MSIEQKFKAAVNVIQNLPKDGKFQASDELKLKFYAYFKQATEGPNTHPKPAFYDVVGRYKWDAWKKLGDMPREEAMTNYVEELKKIVETMALSKEVSEFYEVLGPFFEFCDVDKGDGDLPNGHVPTYKEAPKANGTLVPNGPTKMNGSAVRLSEVDSDGDEFSDTYDHLSRGDGEVPISSRNGALPPLANDTRAVTFQESTRNGEVAHETIASQNSQYIAARQTVPAEINDQVRVAVIRLQQSMDQVVGRLNALETRVSNQSNESSRQRRLSPRPVLFGLSPQALTLMVIWPFVAQWLVHYIRRRRGNN